MISFMSSLEIINVILPDPKIFLWLAASVADTAAVNPNCIKTLLANGFNTFFIKVKPVFSNDPRILPKKPPDCLFLCYWIFYSFILAKDLFVKVLRRFKTCVSVNNNLFGKLFSSLESPETFDETFKVTSVPHFIPEFNLLSFYWI